MSRTELYEQLFAHLDTLPKLTSEDAMNVEELMTDYVLAIDVDATLGSAKNAMEKHAIRHLPVVDDGQVIGMLSQRELSSAATVASHFNAERDAYEAYLDTPVRQFLKTRFSTAGDVVTVRADDPLETAIDVLIAHRLSALPVLGRRGDLIGIISYVDILAGLKGILEQIRE